MPIYEVDGRRANVRDDSVDKFLGEYPDAKLVEETPQQQPNVNAEKINERTKNMLSGSAGDVLKGTPFERKTFDQAATEATQRYGANHDNRLRAQLYNFGKQPELYEKAEETGNAKNLPPAALQYLQDNADVQEIMQYIPSSAGGMMQSTTTRTVSPEKKKQVYDYFNTTKEGQEEAKAYTAQINSAKQQLDSIANLIKSNMDVLYEKGNFSNERFQTLMTAAKQVQAAKKAIETANDASSRGNFMQFIGEFERSVLPMLEDVTSFGISEIKDNLDIKRIVDKSNKNGYDSLNDNEKLVLESMALSNMIQGWHGQERTVPQDVARAFADSMPFMTNFGVLNAPAKAVTRGAAGAVKGAIKGATKKALQNGVSSAFAKGVARTAGAGSNLADVIIRSGVMATLDPHTYAQAIDDATGKAGFEVDENNQIVYTGHEGAMTFVDAALKRIGTQTIEYISEHSGFMFSKIGGMLKNSIPALGKNIASTPQFFTGVKSTMAQMGWNGTVEEFLEEQVSTVLNAAFQTGEGSWEDLIDPRGQLVTFLTVAAIGSGAGALNIAGNQAAKQSIRYNYNSAQRQFNRAFANVSGGLTADDVALFNETLASGTVEQQQEMLTGILMSDASDAQKEAATNLYTRNLQYQSLQGAKESVIEQRVQEAAQIVQENSNPQMNSVMSATIGGYENPMQVVGGNIVQNEDGSINRDLSDQSVTIIDTEGKRVPVSIKFVESVAESIPTEDATAQAAEIVTQEESNQLANEEVRPYEVGEVVTADAYGNGIPFTGEVAGVTEDGKYIIVGIQSGQQMIVEPRQIVNQDNIQGVEDGSTIEYRNENGEVTQGVVGSMYALRPQGMIALENGEAIPIENVIGLAEISTGPQNSINTPVSNSVEVENQQVRTENSPATEEQVTVPFIEQIPQDEKGNLLFDQVPAETTIGALKEVYSDTVELSGVVDATISNVQKQIEKAKAPKPTGDINKDIANKRVANQQLEELNNRLSYWQGVRNGIRQSQPIEQRVTEQLTGEETTQPKRKPTVKRPTSFQKRLNTLEDSVHSIHDKILFGIASGAYRFRWKDKGVSMGLARELGLSGSEAERRARIGLLSNDGYTPTTLAHHIWEDSNVELNDNDIRSEIIEILNTVYSRKQALEMLEENTGINEQKRYEQEQEEVSAYESELRAQEEAFISEISDGINEETFVSLMSRAAELEATEQQLAEVFTTNDFINLIEQLEYDGQESDARTDNEEDQAYSSERNTLESTSRRTEERNRSAETESAERQDSDSAGNGLNLSPEEQRVVAQAAAEIDAEIAEVEKELAAERKELSAAKKRLGKAQAETQGNLFGFDDENKPSSLFDVAADLSKKNVQGAIIKPIQDRITFLNSNIANLKGKRERRINEALDSFRRQGNVFDEIARAETGTNTNPTEAQKEAGNETDNRNLEKWQFVADEYNRLLPSGDNIEVLPHAHFVNAIEKEGIDCDDRGAAINLNDGRILVDASKITSEEQLKYILAHEKFHTFVREFLSESELEEAAVELSDILENMPQGYENISDEEKVDEFIAVVASALQARGILDGFAQGNISLSEIDSFITNKAKNKFAFRLKPYILNILSRYERRRNEDASKTNDAIEIGSNEHRRNVGNAPEEETSIDNNEADGRTHELSRLRGRSEKSFRVEGKTVENKANERQTEEQLERLRREAEQEAQQDSPAYGASNTLISTEQYEELRKRMRDKLNNQLNVGFDPELFTIGTQMAMYHIEAGARKFADFASRMVTDLGDGVKPYLKSFYESARHAPGMESLSKEMDSFNEVNSYDLENIATFEESNTPKNSINETNRNNGSNDDTANDGRVSTGIPATDVRKQSATTETGHREQSTERPAVETDNTEQRGRSERSTGNNADASTAELHPGKSEPERNRDNGRTDRGNANETGKPLNTNNNRQERGENVVPRGNAAKINANIAAIKLAKRLFETGKKATPEQMNALRRYTGWGGLSSVFQPNDKNYKALQEVLTDEEYESARASTTTAFYTPQEITSSVWDMIEKLGFKGGAILEPSAGIGNFFALMPEAISNASHLRGVELDSVSGLILKLLYPDAKIDIAGFEKQRIANNSIDLVVSNVPFGNFKVHDTFDKDLSSQFDIHDYFIAKSVRKLKAGGIGVFITTSSTLDKSAALRNWIINNGNADFIDAVRLNTDTFKNDAGTEATADIIIIRKRDVSGRSSFEKNMQDSVVAREATYTQQERNSWGGITGDVEKKARMTYNKFFIDNPQRLAGEMKFGFEGGNAIRPTEQRLAPTKAINQQEVIERMISELPGDIYNSTPAEQTSKAVANNGTKEGGLTIIDGQPYVVRFDTAVSVDWNNNKVSGYPKTEALQDYMAIKNAINELLEAENSADNEPTHLNKLRNNLNKAYDSFVEKYGTLNENRKINFLQDDVDFSSVSAIENVEDNQSAGEKTISKSDIFSKRVIDKQAEPKAESVTDAVRVSINQNGKVDIPYIARLLGKTNTEVQSEIVNSRIGFVNPETGLVESRNQYLSGNVRDKLSIAQQANQDNEYDTNIEELSKVIPTDIPINLIKMTLGSTWIPERVYNDFFKETFDVEANIRKTSTDKYISKLYNKNNAKDAQMGMPEAGGSVLALNAMNNTTTTISMQVWEDGKRKTVTDPLKTAQAAAKQTELAETFEAWVKQKKEYAEELENIYNNTFNAIVNSKVDVDSFDRFPGVSGKVVRVATEESNTLKQFRTAKENIKADNDAIIDLARKLKIDYDKNTGLFSTDSGLKAAQFEKEANGTAKILRQHQKEGVIRGLEGATLLAHEVGTGKTLTLITTAMEMRRLGLAKKPAIVVQRSTYKQFVKEIKNQYPNAKVLAPSSKDLTAKERQQLFAKIAYNDWDIVVLYHSYLDSIPDDPGRVAQYIDERIQEKMEVLEEMERAKEDGAANAGRMIGALKKEIQRLERERDNTLNPEQEEDETEGKSKRKRSVKDIEKVRANTEARIERSLDRRTDNTMTFEQLGIDALLVDEAHAYKKLGFVTSLQRVKGIDTGESKRAQSTRLKSSYILENHNGKNVVFATGTPISNTMAEMWTFLRYLLPRTEMSRLQMNNFDAFVNNFGSIEESAEFVTNGKFRVTNRFSSYSNVPELIAAWRQVAHTVLTEEVSTLKEGVGTPRVEGGKPTDVMLEQTAPLKSVMKGIKNKLEEFERMSGAQKKENSYIPLVMFGLAKRAAIDVRLVDPNLPDDVNSKTNIAVRDILQDLKDTAVYKGTIAVFCDSYQSSDKTFNVFRDIKQKLVDNGIPAEQIAIINDYEKDDAKEKLFAAVNNGDIRVVMGTTEKLGVGVNIQERLHMAGHLDAPIRPSDYQQRNGRIIRQGNTHLNMDKTVKIVRWGVKKTLDVTGYQRLEIKKKFIDQIMKGDVSQRMLEEADIESTDSANFNQMMANLSGSQAALALSIEQNKLKKLYNARQYHNDNQIYITSAVKRAKGVIVGNGQMVERLEKYKADVQSSIPGGKITEVSIGKVTANTPDDIDALLNKHITKKVDAEVEALRNDFQREFSQLKTSISVNGIKLDLTINIKRNYDVDTRKTRVTREIRYTTPNNTVANPFFKGENNASPQEYKKTVPLFDDYAGANVQNVINQINYELSGQDINTEMQKYKIGMDKAQRDIDAYESQIGQEFAKEKELQATEQKVGDLEAQMREELKAIEAEEAKEEVEAIDIDDVVSKNIDDNPEDDPTPPTGGRRRQTTSSGSFDTVPATKFDRLVDKLNQTGLATDVIIDEDINTSHAIQDKEGNVYGYVTPDGVVHLDAWNMNANTPVHEFGHLWVSFIKANDTALYNRGKELVMQSEYWERVNNNPDYANLPEEEKVDEALAMAIGDKGEAVWNKQRNLTLYIMVKGWLYDIWRLIKQVFGISERLNVEDMALSDFTDLAVGDLLGGKRLSDNALLDSEKNNIFVIDKKKQYVSDQSTSKERSGLSEQTGSETGMDNERAMGSGTISSLVGRPESRSGIYKTIQAGNSAGSVDAVYEVEELEELESRGINPYWDKTAFRKELKKYAGQNGVLLDKSYLNDKILIHDQKKSGTSENDVYLNPDGKTITKVNNLGYVKGSELHHNLNALIDRLAAHNVLFPEISYDIKGFIENKNGDISLVMEQPYVDAERNATKEEIEEYLIGKGLSLAGSREWSNSHEVWSNGVYELFDARPANVLKGKDGKLYFIDTFPHSVGYFKKGHGKEENSIRFQSVGDIAKATGSTMTEDVRNQLDRKIKRFRNRLREQWEDRHLPVKTFLDVLRKNGTEVAEYNDYYKQATHINGKIDAQLEHYNEKYQRPLNKAIANLEKAGLGYRTIENYAILKHGLERNEWMRNDAINKYKEEYPEATLEQIDKFAERLPDDFSGITTVQEEVGVSAEEFISKFEDKAGNTLINDFWSKIKAATTYSLQKQKEGGLIDKKMLDELTSRYKYYIPLRGHDAEVAEDRWDYSPNMGTYFVAPLIKAKGRKTRSESPFAFVFSMAQSSINSTNRNLLNQTILRLANKDKTGLLGVNKAWYVQGGLNEEGKPVYEVQSPTYSENPEQYSRNIEEFEARMQQLAESGLAVQSGSRLDIGGLFIKRDQAKQHEVHVYQNGTEYVVYINANPAVARAITGANAKDLHKDLRFIARVSRQMAATFTTRNPSFVFANFSRDYIFASSILPVKENIGYALQFQKNMPFAAAALQRYIRGSADLTKQNDRYVIEYIMNGAKTGFSHIIELQKIQKQIEREIKKGDKKNPVRHILDALGACNDFAENLSRLSVYITSREQGRSIIQSVSDAKEVTVNFNRNGAGGWGAAWFRSLYLFVNAGIQALSNFAKVAQKNKGKTALLVSSYTMTGFLMPMLTYLIGGDDGLDEYMKLSDWERQNNLCIYTGNGFIKIPLPHELRVFHKMGDEIYQSIFGKKDVTESLLDTALGFSDLIPANPMGAVQASWAEVMPDAMKPFFQLSANTDFTGRKITNEWADENKPGYLRVKTNKKGDPYAPAFLVKLSENLDNVTGGDGVVKGLVSFNPDEVNHVLRGYFGGLYSMGMQVLDVSSKTYDWTQTGEFKLKVRETPLRTFFASSDDLQTASSGLNSKYFKIADDIQETRRKVKGYQEQATKGQIGIDKFAEKIKGMSGDLERYKRIYPLMKQIKKYESALKELDSDQQKAAEKIISNLKKEVVEINSIVGK